MIHLILIINLLFVGNLNEASTNTDPLKDSEITFLIYGGGIVIDQSPFWEKYTIKNVNGTVSNEYTYRFHDKNGKEIEKTEILKITKKEYNLIWKKLNEKNLMNLKSISPIHIPPEDFLKEYSELRNGKTYCEISAKTHKKKNYIFLYDLPKIINKSIKDIVIILFKLWDYRWDEFQKSTKSN
jgi:hypothetical protein